MYKQHSNFHHERYEVLLLQVSPESPRKIPFWIILKLQQKIRDTAVKLALI